MSIEALSFDPFDPDRDEDKRFAIYRQARDEQPVMLHEGPLNLLNITRSVSQFQ